MSSKRADLVTDGLFLLGVGLSCAGFTFLDWRLALVWTGLLALSICGWRMR